MRKSILFGALAHRRCAWLRRGTDAKDENLDAVSPIHFAARFKLPLLIRHGEEDKTVPPKQSHKMVEALQKAAANVTQSVLQGQRA